MKLLVSIFIVICFLSIGGMQKEDPYFETKFEMAKIHYPRTAKELRKAEDVSIFMGGIAAFAVSCALASYFGSQQNPKMTPKLYGLTIGCSGLFCISSMKTANNIRKNLIALALEIADDDAYHVQDMGIETYRALKRF